MRDSRARVAAACVALVVAVGLAGSAAGQPSARPTVDRLTLEQQVGQVILLRFLGTTPPESVLAALRARRAAGVTLFGDNVASPEQLRSLTRLLRGPTGRPIIAVDQEGGAIRRLPWAPPFRAEAQQAAAGTAGSSARAAAVALRAAGITVSLAPVADVPSVSGAALEPRAFSRDPAVASRATASAVRGWRAGGVAATAKHFPGLGGATANTDRASVTIRRSRAELEQVDLAPFRAAIAAGVPLVMVGHARYPALDRNRIASQSRPILEGLLRDGLGFRGAVVTDGMEARASLATGTVAVAAERAIRAGADLVLLTKPASYERVYPHLLALARSSPAFRARVRDAAARVLTLKARGALSPR
jgi:beta-N-acetylhexosaminidase